MIIITGASGFIGSYLVGYLNSTNFNEPLILVDDIPEPTQFLNLVNKKFKTLISTDDLFDFIKKNENEISTIIHLGAISSTLENNWSKLYKYNVSYTEKLYRLADWYNIKTIFISSAAVYGNEGYPLNQYAFSKKICEQIAETYNSIILRPFNVYGPNEYHKGNMSSVILQWYNQLNTSGKINLFEDSINFKRDFIYVEDVCKIIELFIKKSFPENIYDVGTGISTSFQDLAEIFLNTMFKNELIYDKYINYVKMENNLKKQYQVNTNANNNLKNFNYISVKDGVSKYVSYLKKNKIF